MFYTKYRPQKFVEVSRPNEAADVLSKQVKDGKTVHAYLFIGPRGTGKTTTARILAKALNCKKVDAHGDPCDKCDSCEAIKDGSYADLIEIDAASNRGIDDIRELKDKVKLAPSRGKRKVYIIDEVHMLTAEAFNALLKTLEEPPKNVVFILCTTEAHKVPDTIKSRCQVFRFKRATVAQIVNKLKDIAKEEKSKVSEDTLTKVAQASLGGFRDAETLFQQVIEGDFNVEHLLSVSSHDVYIEFVDALLNKNALKATKTVNKVFEEGVDLYLWVGELLKYLRELLFAKSDSLEELSELTQEVIEDVGKQAKKVELHWLIEVINELLEAQKAIKSSFIPQLPVELFIAGICGGKDTSKESSRHDGDDSSDGVSKKSAKISEDRVTTKADKVVEVIEKQSHKVEKTEEKSGNEVSKKDGEGEVESKALVQLDVVCGKWDEVVTKSKALNHSLMALLKSGKPVAIEGKFIIFEVFYPFHKERVESPKNRKLIEGLLEEIFNLDVKIKCTISKEKPKNLKKGESGVLTDFNVAIPAMDKGSLLDVFDGGLPAIN